MNDNVVISLALALVAALFSLLTLIIGWLGNKLYNKLDEMSKNLQTMASELHNRITGIDKRLTRVEAVEAMCNGKTLRRSTDAED